MPSVNAKDTVAPEQGQPLSPEPATEDTQLLATAQPSEAEAPAVGRQQVFRDLRRQLSAEELTQTGVHKLILEELERLDIQCQDLRAYVDRFHAADKECVRL